jgi:large subunit ribosomal protein L28
MVQDIVFAPRGVFMSRTCSITGKRPHTGNNVSHSMRHTRRWFKPNVKKKRILIDGKMVKISISMRALRTLNKKGEL